MGLSFENVTELRINLPVSSWHGQKAPPASLKIYDFADLGEQSFGVKPSKIQYAVSFQKTRQNGADGCLELQE